jgi:hypothetical protein
VFKEVENNILVAGEIKNFLERRRVGLNAKKVRTSKTSYLTIRGQEVGKETQA